MSLNSYKMAEVAFKILRERGEMSLEDIVRQFEISVSTAYNVQRALRALCENNEACEVVIKNRRTVFVWHSSKELQEKDEKDEEENEREEIEKILDAHTRRE